LIAIASTAGLKGYGYVAPYCAAKHGVVGLVKALAAELAGSAITVNAVCPGFTDTPMLAQSIANIAQKTGMSIDDARANLAKINPQNRFITPREIAETVLWLCQQGAGAITGQAISVSGGEI
jgi:NAD(P)-dependent dehydrogenase (short-subunit alcohol dehydrogenase family)